MFEVAIGRDVRPDGSTLLFPGNSFRIVLRHEVTGGDRATVQILTHIRRGRCPAASADRAGASVGRRCAPDDVNVVSSRTAAAECGGNAER
jgi:hypothetical protein